LGSIPIHPLTSSPPRRLPHSPTHLLAKSCATLSATSLDTLIKNLSAIVGSDSVLSKPDELLVYECDGLPHHKYRPRAVVFPSSTDETAAIMRELVRANVPFTPRG